ncbi:MAG: hypothetical protein M1836_001962 [Candelina mexicana]|nr:MAG: hypothetical protein M1836_001962 [Candelina mexicana]
MNLSNLVQGDKRPADPQEVPRGQASSPFHHRPYQSHVRKNPVHRASPYSSPSPDLYRHSQVPHPPPSPPMENPKKCSLPPISSLLAETSLLEQKNGTFVLHPDIRGEAERIAPAVGGIGHRMVSRQQSPDHDTISGPLLPAQPVKGSSGINLPPTPPLRPDSVQNSTHSSSSRSSNSSAIAPSSYFGHAINNVDATIQRQPQHSTSGSRRIVSSNPSVSPVTVSSFTRSPSQNPTQACHSPDINHQERSPAMFYQRSLPSTFPPVTIPGSVSPPTTSGENPWQHHHYISASAQADFPQSQDRYICQTCTKAFSRPSSLRIHSHSHTGEKPFKCPHQGCGKAFSVRSNMKRHERGCHNAASPASL